MLMNKYMPILASRLCHHTHPKAGNAVNGKASSSATVSATKATTTRW